MLWIKAAHIVFVVSWFAGLFYLPRILVNLALETDAAAAARLLTMARKLYRFMTIPAILAILSGMLLISHGFGQGPANGWLPAKLALVVLLIGYHHACGSLLRKFEIGKNKRSHTWYRWFNEVPAVLLVAIVALVVVKPF